MAEAPVRHVPDAERRARLAVRHALHPDHRRSDPVEVARAMTALHATEPATVHLAVAARAEGVAATDVDRALEQDRTLVRQLAMRRTQFVLSRDLLPATWGSASARVAAQQRRLLVRDAERHGIARDGEAWLRRARAAVEERLAGSAPMSAPRLREELPELAGTVVNSPGRSYGGATPVGPRVLTWLGAEAALVRGPNAGPWHRSRPTWTLMRDWLGEEPSPEPVRPGYAALVRHWLRTFGPGTTEDLQWWLGGTKTAVRTALADVDAVPVSLDDGGTGWLLPDDLEPVAPPGPWAALLPTLDPTLMGWRGRAFYLDAAHVPLLFDSNGNGGTTAWWDGRVVGTWVQDDDGTVSVVPVPGAVLPVEARSALDREADRLTAWLDGVRVTNVYASRLARGEPLP